MSQYISSGQNNWFDVRIVSKVKKRAQDFELLKQVPESPHCLDFSGLNQYIGTLILSQSAFLRIVARINHDVFTHYSHLVNVL